MFDINSILNKYPFVKKDDLVPILQDVQEQQGYLSEDAIKKIGEYIGIATSKIYGLATFYSYFRFVPKGKYHIKICEGTTCHINKSKLLITELYKKLKIRDKETAKNNLFSLEITECMGACSMGPVMSINDKYYTNLTLDSFNEIIDSYINN